jgi:hypothetical protein
MTKTSPETLKTDTPVVLGEFPLADALAAARNLEHAGITATLATANGVWSLGVQPGDLERARRLV